LKIASSTYRLVYALSQHPRLGVIIEAFSVKLNPDKSFSLSFHKVNRQNLKKEDYVVHDHDLDLIELIDQYSEEQIVKKFSKKRLKFPDFIQKLDDKQIEEQIRPFIEKRIFAIYQKMQEKSVRLYYKGTKKEHIRDQAIQMLKKQTEIIFNFDRREDEIRYYLNIEQNKKAIDLFGKELLILCNKPALLYMDSELHYFEKDVDSKKFRPFVGKQYVSIPKEKEKQYFRTFVYQSIRKYEVKAKGFQITHSSKHPIPQLRVQKTWQNDYAFRLEFVYGQKSIASDDSQSVYVDMKNKDDNYYFVRHIRQTAFENQIRKVLENHQLRFLENALYVPHQEKQSSNSLYELINYCNQYESLLKQEGIHIIQIEQEVKYYTGKVELEIRISEKPDWFDMHAMVKFNEFEIPFIRFRKNIINNIREYKLPDGSLVILPEEWFDQYRDVLAFAEKSGDEMHLKKHFFNILESVPGFESDFKSKFEKLCHVHMDTSDVDVKEVRAELRPYQKAGFSWMDQLTQQHFGCCLADDMGLGKTLQTLALLQKHQQKRETPAPTGKEVQLDLFSDSGTDKRLTSLIIMPTSLLFNWANEIRKFTPGLRYFIHEGMKRPKSSKLFSYYDLVLSSYGVVRNDIDLFKDFDFNYVILDESQFIKNSDSKGFKAVMQLQSNHRIVLTGTPIENSLNDLWSQMSFINPGILGDRQYFRKEFLKPIEKQKDEVKAEKLQKLIGPFILRRTKEEVAKDLPHLSEQIHYCSMTDAHHSYYEKKKSQIRNLLMGQIKSGDISKKMIAILRALMQLRLIANHPVLVDPDYKEDSGKLKEIIRFVENASAGQHKCLLFSSFVKHLNVLSRYHEESGKSYLYLSGQTKSAERKQIVQRFQEDESIRSFLVSIKAGGVGLNLTAADYIFILDPWWNPAVESQAINRAHRIGQDKKVFAYKFITKGSIEEKIVQLQKNKKGLADSFINNNNPLRVMKADEIEDLFR
jgi:SNF2 family DNA or RNA helicase